MSHSVQSIQTSRITTQCKAAGTVQYTFAPDTCKDALRPILSLRWGVLPRCLKAFLPEGLDVGALVIADEYATLLLELFPLQQFGDRDMQRLGGCLRIRTLCKAGEGESRPVLRFPTTCPTIPPGCDTGDTPVRIEVFERVRSRSIDVRSAERPGQLILSATTVYGGKLMKASHYAYADEIMRTLKIAGGQAELLEVRHGTEASISSRLSLAVPT